MNLEDLKRTLEHRLLAFGKITMPAMFQKKSPRVHEEWERLYHDTTVTKRNIIAARGHAKSSIWAGIVPLHHVLAEKDPIGPRLVLLVSKSEEHSIRLLQTIKDAIEYSVPLRAIYGYHGRHVAKQWKYNFIHLDNGNAILAKGLGQQVVGVKVGNQRPTLVVGDDIEDQKNTITEKARSDNLEWVLRQLDPCVDPVRGRVFLIGTPQHQACVSETLKKMENWKTHVYPAIQPNGEALWEEWMPLAYLDKLRRGYESIGRTSFFHREYLCEVTGGDDAPFQEHHMKEYDGIVEVRNADPYLVLTSGEVFPVHVYVGVDPASSLEEHADQSAIVPVAVDAYMNRYVLPYFAKRVAPMQLVDEMINIAKKHPYLQKMRIENNSIGAPIKDALRAVCEREGIFIPGIELKEHAILKKQDRNIALLQPLFAQGKIFLRKDMYELKQQLLAFPKGKHDDLVDGLFYAVKGNYRPFHAETSPPRPVKNQWDYFSMLEEDETDPREILIRAEDKEFEDELI